MFGDTISAIATATGAAGVGIIRISGPEAVSILEKATKRQAGEPRKLCLRKIYSAAGDAIDSALVVTMPGPRSFTGEDVVEIQGHGGAAILQALLKRTLELGARLAMPGEFTRRALANDQLDLLEAELLLEKIASQSDRGLRLLEAQQRGVKNEIGRMRKSIDQFLAEMEAHIDFPEEGLPKEDVLSWQTNMSDARSALSSLAEAFERNRRTHDGIVVVLRGPVNAGKSSLFNALVDRPRALVSDEAGTTRDFIEEKVIWDGVPVTLIDTAGIRTDASDIESQGIAMGEEQAAASDLQIFLFTDLSEPLREGPKVMCVASKADTWTPPDGMLATSSVTGDGVESLRKKVVQRALGSDMVETPSVVTLRQFECLTRAMTALNKGEQLLGSTGELELISIELREAQSALADLVGDEVSDEVLDELFSKFCIGK